MTVSSEIKNDKHAKNARTLDMFVRLCEGRVLNKAAEAERFGVDERSIQRDIDDIRAFLSARISENGEFREVEYDRNRKGYVMTGAEPALMTNSEILAVSKIILESRAFTNRELKKILDKLVKGCVPERNMELVSRLLANETFHYVELHQKEYVSENLWTIANDIAEQNLVRITYSRAAAPRESIKRTVEPVAIMFSEYYFYLNAFIVEKNEEGKIVHKYDYPAIFRIDRIKNYTTLPQKFKTPYASRFEEGIFRQRVQFMYAGQLIKIRLRYLGANPSPVLDRLPTATVIEQYDNESIIEAEVYGKGCLMWILSQADKIEILQPESLRNEMKKTLESMLALYK